MGVTHPWQARSAGVCFYAVSKIKPNRCHRCQFASDVATSDVLHLFQSPEELKQKCFLFSISINHCTIRRNQLYKHMSIKWGHLLWWYISQNNANWSRHSGLAVWDSRMGSLDGVLRVTSSLPRRFRGYWFELKDLTPQMHSHQKLGVNQKDQEKCEVCCLQQFYIRLS